MEWIRVFGTIFEEYLRQTADYETEFLWLIEESTEALIRLLCAIF